MSETFQTQRFERKYFVSQAQALHIREFVRNHLVLDEYGLGKVNYAYPIHSVYLDSDQLTTYWATVHGEKSRFKLRLRFYDDHPNTPVFFEVKRRMNDCILKQRVAVRKDAAAALVGGDCPGPEHLLNQKASDLASLQNFSKLMRHLSARPKMQVAYFREAWISHESNSLRVTFDREIRGAVATQIRLSTNMVHPFRPVWGAGVYGDKVVLELKYTHHFPEWYRDLVQQFNLLQSGVPKYCGTVDGRSEEPGSAPVEWHGAPLPPGWRKHF
jgi:hypothetical protein